MSAISRERLKQIFDSGELDPISRTNRIKDQESKLKQQEARIRELEELYSKKPNKKEKPTRQKKTLTDEQKQSLKERLALGKKKKQESNDKTELDEPKPQETTKSKPKTKMTSDDIDIDDLLNKMNERLKQKALEKQSQLKAETPRHEADKSLTPVTAESRPESRPESVLTSKYNKFLRNVSKPKYY